MAVSNRTTPSKLPSAHPSLDIRCPCGNWAYLDAPKFEVNFIGMLQFRCRDCGQVTNAPEGMLPGSMHPSLRDLLLAWLGRYGDALDPKAVSDLQDLLGVPHGELEEPE